MDERDPNLKAAMGRVLQGNPSQALRRESPSDEEHLTPDRLVAYHHDQLSPEEVSVVQEHLAACRPCADLMLELIRFGADDGQDAEASDAEAAVADLEAEADWKALRFRIGEPEAAGTGLGVSVSEMPPPAAPRFLAYGLAASLLLTVGLGVWVTVLKGELRQPKINLAIVNLQPDGVLRGSADEETVHGAGERFVVILNHPSTFPPAIEHRVEILNAAGFRVWSGLGLVPTKAGNFNLELSRRLLVPGEYLIRLLDGDELVAEYDLQLAP